MQLLCIFGSTAALPALSGHLSGFPACRCAGRKTTRESSPILSAQFTRIQKALIPTVSFSPPDGSSGMLPSGTSGKHRSSQALKCAFMSPLSALSVSQLVSRGSKGLFPVVSMVFSQPAPKNRFSLVWRAWQLCFPFCDSVCVVKASGE